MIVGLVEFALGCAPRLVIRESLEPVSKGTIDAVLASLGLCPTESRPDAPQPCFDLDVLHRRNSKAALRQARGDLRKCN